MPAGWLVIDIFREISIISDSLKLWPYRLTVSSPRGAEGEAGTLGFIRPRTKTKVITYL